MASFSTGSYEKARNIAAESDYTSITEILGRGCRISKPTDAKQQYNKRFASPVVNGFQLTRTKNKRKTKKLITKTCVQNWGKWS
ncbi:hypothetical protein RN001_001758 [Aquatica leii]|uniref:Uncharacterized protein n=1 Tax=Aquatica leii TaxID=1421715 RepID=A0AAN7Q826_9COLE|nr:hypothetical protein RN001_001758 [Aquatica leii]